MIHVSQLGDDFFVFDQASQSLIGQNRGQSFSLGDEVRIKVAGVNLEERKIDFELVQQLSHAGRAIRSRAPRVAKPTTKEEVFDRMFKEPADPALVIEGGEKPVGKKKPRAKASEDVKKSAKKSSPKSAEQKAKDKAKKKAKAKKKKANAKAKVES